MTKKLKKVLREHFPGIEEQDLKVVCIAILESVRKEMNTHYRLWEETGQSMEMYLRKNKGRYRQIPRGCMVVIPDTGD